MNAGKPPNYVGFILIGIVVLILITNPTIIFWIFSLVSSLLYVIILVVVLLIVVNIYNRNR